MNLIKNATFALLLTSLIVSCEEDDFVRPSESTKGTGLTEITFSSFTAKAGPDESGLEDGTYITVTPIGIGVDSYVVDFGAAESTPVTIVGGSGTATSYDYPNNVEQADYTVTVTAKSDKGLDDVTLTEVITVKHELTAISSSPNSPTILDENVYAIFSDGMEVEGALVAYTNLSSSANFTAGTDVEYNKATVGDIKNNVIQYSRLESPNTASIAFDPAIMVADVFGTDASADYIHFDLHSIHEIGVDKVKISMGGKTFEQTLENNVWTGLDIDLTSEGITQIDEIVIELGTDGTASNEATLNVDNIYFYREPLSIPEFTFDEVASDFDVTFENASELATSYSWDFGDGSGSSTDENPTYTYTDNGIEETYMVTLTTTNFLNKTTSITKEVTVGGPAGPMNPEIVKGDFERLDGNSSDDGNIRNAWKIATTGNSNPFGTSSDGSCIDYSGTLGSKTRGAKWSSSQSANPDGSAVAGDTRYAYQSVTLSPNEDYIFEYEYAIRTGGAETNSVVASILNGHYSDSADAVASNALIKHVGTESKGKFSDNDCSGGTTVKLQFRSNAVGEVAILIYAVTDKDAYIDNVKIYPAP
ncbi:PKD domain-containing protein [Flavicella sediminum]|uniref:PKD domain-containing protein n=1 Tax=Flavicella sediminum TaxID=2585141 RepID=UPI001AA08D03|nr:PKD domain-containing protein [Flavicella sediminum]